MSKLRIPTAVIMALVMVMISGQPSAASGYDVVNEIQDILDSNGFDAAVSILSREEQEDIWTFIRSDEAVSYLLQKLDSDGYIRSETEDAVMVISDDKDDDLVMYYYFMLYVDNDGQMVFVMVIYMPYVSLITGIWSEKISDNVSEEYYFYTYDGPVPAGDFNMTSFLCGLSGTVACSLFSAMLFALVPVSIVAGMTCSAAFAYVCSYAG